MFGLIYDKHHEIIGIMEMHFASSDEDGTQKFGNTIGVF